MQIGAGERAEGAGGARVAPLSTHTKLDESVNAFALFCQSHLLG